MPLLRIATFNVNGVNGRLPRLLEWLDETRPDIVCLQEIKTGDGISGQTIEAAGYGAIWHGHAPTTASAILARGEVPRELRRGLPAMPTAGSLSGGPGRGMRIASVYLPNGNPQPGPKFDYKLAWFERLIRHAQTLIDGERGVVLAGDFNVVPTDADIYNAWLWRFDAVLQPQSRHAYRRLLAQGWTDATRHLHPTSVSTRSGSTQTPIGAMQGSAWTSCSSIPRSSHRLARAGVDSEHRGREGRATTRRCGSSWICPSRFQCRARC